MSKVISYLIVITTLFGNLIAVQSENDKTRNAINRLFQDMARANNNPVRGMGMCKNSLYVFFNVPFYLEIETDTIHFLPFTGPKLFTLFRDNMRPLNASTDMVKELCSENSDCEEFQNGAMSTFEVDNKCYVAVSEFRKSLTIFDMDDFSKVDNNQLNLADIPPSLIGIPFSACGKLPKPHLRFLYSLSVEKARTELSTKNNSQFSKDLREIEKNKLVENNYLNISGSLATVSDDELSFNDIPGEAIYDFDDFPSYSFVFCVKDTFLVVDKKGVMNVAKGFTDVKHNYFGYKFRALVKDSSNDQNKITIHSFFNVIVLTFPTRIAVIIVLTLIWTSMWASMLYCCFFRPKLQRLPARVDPVMKSRGKTKSPISGVDNTKAPGSMAISTGADNTKNIPTSTTGNTVLIPGSTAK